MKVLDVGYIPPGVIPNFDHPQSRVIDLRIGLPICLGVALIFVLLRLYVKLAIIKMWNWDDGEFLRKITLLEAHSNRRLPDRICETWLSFDPLVNNSDNLGLRG